jgi:hypothetical protein
MPTTAPISYERAAPGSRQLTFTLNGVAPNMTGWTGRLQVWRSGASVISTNLFQLATPSQITLGPAGAISIDMVAFESEVVTHAPNEAVFHYVLDVQDGSNPRVAVSSGPVARNQP